MQLKFEKEKMVATHREHWRHCMLPSKSMTGDVACCRRRYEQKSAKLKGTNFFFFFFNFVLINCWKDKKNKTKRINSLKVNWIFHLKRVMKNNVGYDRIAHKGYVSSKNNVPSF